MRMTVRELIGGEIAWIEPAGTLRQAARQMHSADIGALAVESEDVLHGIFTERDRPVPSPQTPTSTLR
jgi:CBS domain-containing protein